MGELQKRIAQLRELGLSDDGIRRVLADEGRLDGINEEVIVGLLKGPIDRLADPVGQSSTAVAQSQARGLSDVGPVAHLDRLLGPRPADVPTDAAARTIAQIPLRHLGPAQADAAPARPADPRDPPTLSPRTESSPLQQARADRAEQVRQMLDETPAALRLLATAGEDIIGADFLQEALSRAGLAPDPANSLIREAEQLGITSGPEKAASVGGMFGGIGGQVGATRAVLGKVAPRLMGAGLGPAAARAGAAEAVVSGADFGDRVVAGEDPAQAALIASLFGLTGVGAEIGLGARAARAARGEKAAQGAADEAARVAAAEARPRLEQEQLADEMLRDDIINRAEGLHAESLARANAEEAALEAEAIADLAGPALAGNIRERGGAAFRTPEGQIITGGQETPTHLHVIERFPEIEQRAEEMVPGFVDGFQRFYTRDEYARLTGQIPDSAGAMGERAATPLQADMDEAAARKAARMGAPPPGTPGTVSLTDDAADEAVSSVDEFRVDLPEGPPAGAVDPALLAAGGRAAIGGAVGGVAGGQAAEDDPVAGAIIGAVGGAAAGALASPRARRTAARIASGAWRRGETPEALAAQDVAGILATRKLGPKGAPQRVPKHGPTSGFTPDMSRPTEEFIGDLDRLNLDTPTTEVIRALVDETVATRGLPSQAQRRMTWSETRRMAAKIGFEDLPADARRLTQDEAQATFDQINQAGRYITEITGRLTDPHLVPDEKIRLEFRLSQLETRMGDLLETFNTTRSQFGRNLNILKQFASQTDNPLLWYARAKRFVDGPFTAEMRETIDRLLAEGDMDALTRYVASLRRPTAQDKGLTIWKAGLLTAPTTHMANVLGNTSMAALEAAKDPPAVLYDMLISSLITGRRTKGSGLAGVRSLEVGARRGAEGAKHAARTGAVDPNLYGKYELKFGEIDFQNPVLNFYTRTVFRGLLAGDQFFRGIALQRSLVDQAEAAAINAGLKGEARRARVKELLVNPDIEMALKAVEDAELATFINTPRVDLARDFQRSAGLAGHVVLPFAKTPSNIIERAFEYSPLGPLARARGTHGQRSEISKLLKAALGDVDSLDAAAQRKLVDTLGRSTVGTAAVVAGYMLASHDKLTGAYPRGREANKWKQEGRTENSILLKGNWWRLDRLSPVGNLMVFGAAMWDAVNEMAQENDDPSLLHYVSNAPEALFAGALGGAQSLLKQSFLVNMNETLEVLTGDQRGSVAEGARRMLQSYAGSLVPTIIRKVAAGVDQGVKERETVLDGIKAGAMPGLLEDKLDTFGRPVRRPSGVTEQLLNPFTRSPDLREDSPAIAKLSELDVVVARRNPMANETPEMFRKRQIVEGRYIREAITQTINNGEFNKLSQEQQREVLTQIISNTRAAMTRAFKAKYILEAK